jgi:flavin reductase (DIM6/NTAB) family NADH-FMN oxidoreductase RutF
MKFTSLGRKDTRKNIEANGQFVMNLAPEPLFERINAREVEGGPPDVCAQRL